MDPSSFDAAELDSASNVLLLAPSLGSAGSRVCSKLLSLARPSQENVLAVSLLESPDDWLSTWDEHQAQRPAKLSFITSGEQTRSAAAGSMSDDMMPANMTITSVSNPSDLTGLGMHVSEQLSDWQNEDNQIIVDFDSLTTLLEYNDLQTVFKFMHVLKGRIKGVDAFAHFHMDPGAHEASEVSTFKSLVDAVVEVDEHGECTVSAR